MGYLSDHVPVRIVVVVNCIVACLACTLLWGLGTSDPPLVAFSVLWGLTSGSASGFWSKLITIIARESNVP
jgi:MFS family permease